MPKLAHHPAGIISVTADDNFNPHCLICDAIVPVQTMMMLLRRDSTSAWSAVCIECSVGFMALAIAGEIQTIDF